MLYLLDKDVRTVKWNGIPLHEASSAVVKEETNGDFYLTVRYPITDSGIYQLIKEDMLIKAPVPVLGAQLFRIKKPIENDDGLDITAYHITDDIMQRSINPMNVVRQGCFTALSQMVQNAKTNLGNFSFTSDIADNHTFNTDEVETLYTVLIDGKHSIVGTWEGELVRDNFALSVKRSRGTDRGVVITTHKNLKAYQRTKDSQGVVTRIHARSTFRAEGAEEDTTISVTVDSPLIGNYPYINEKEYQNNDIHSVEELRKWAERKFKYENIDKPTDEIKIEAYELDGQVIHLGDIVNIKSRKHDVDLHKKAIAYEYNALTEEYISITFDDKPGVGGSGVSSGVSNAADVILNANRNAQEVAVERAVRNANQAFDAEFDKRVEVINDGIEQAKAEAELYADNIKQQIDGQLAESDRQYQQAQQAQDRQIADVLAKATSTKEIAEQTVTDLMRVRNAFNQSIGQANTKALELERSIGTILTDVMSQAQTILAQAQAQTALTSRVTTVENLADGTRSTVAELSKTVNKATGDIASVTSRTKSVEDALSQTRTQYETLTQTINTQTGQIESINRKTADLQSGINGVTERFENLQVGGENLLLNAGFEDAKDRSETFAVGGVVYTNKLMPKWGSLYNSGISNPTTSYHAIYRESFNGKGPVIEFNESNGQRNWKGINAILRAEDFVAGNYMFSADVYATGPGTKIWFGFYYYNKRGSRSFHDGQTTVNITTTNSWHRVAGQIKLSDDIDTTKLMYLYIYAYNFESNSILYLTKPQLEYGTVATQFRLAQETLRSEIANYKRTAEESSAELSRQIQTVDGKAVDAKTYAQQTAEGFKTRIESLETYKDGESTRASQYFAASRDETARQVSALRTAVTDGYVAKAKYEEDARGVTQRFEEAQVGSVNLVINSKINETSNLYGFGIRRVRLEAGKKYWFGARARKNGGTADKKTRVYLYSSDWREERVLEFSNDEFTEKFTQFIPTRTQEYLVRSYWFPNGGDRSGHAEVDWYMVTEGTFKPSTWYPAPEDQQSYADTKIAEYKNTVDGQFTNLQSSINGKVSQADFQRVQTTSQLYERIIGSTEAGIKDKVARMVMADSLFLTEVKDKISGTATQVNQLSNSYAIKNLTSNGQILNQINLLANGTNRIDGRLTHITGQTLIDNGVIKNAMIGNLDAGKINTGTLNAARIATNSIDGSKLVFDQAFVNKMIANEALFKQLFAQSAFITSVQAVTMSASKIAGGILSALNGATEFNLQTGQISLKTDGASIQRIADGYPTHFLRFVNDATSYHSTTVLGASKTNTSPNDPTFAGMRIFNSKTKNSIVDLNAYSITFQQYPLATKGFYMDVANQELRPIDSAAQSKVSAKDIYIDSRSLATILDNIFDNFKNLNNNGNYTRNFYSTWR
ncbi:TPA: hypothetical protein U2B72_001170 [Streptococcus suis]|nr:hypothetical protein [Streptococcus suis]